MGLENRQTCIYLSIMNGKVVKQVPEGTAGAQQRTNKSGNVVSEVFYDAVEGVLNGLNVQRHEQYGNQWTFDLVDGGDTYRLDLLEGSYLSTLLTALPMCNLEEPIKITPYKFVANDGKQRTGVSLRQDGKKVERYFTKDDPKGMPELKQVEFAGKMQYDSFKRYQFLEKFVEENIKPKLQGSTMATALAASAAELSESEKHDDLPF